jgi:hypothetical protein
MERIRSWAFPIGMIVVWILVSAYVTSELASMQPMRSARASATAPVVSVART